LTQYHAPFYIFQSGRYGRGAGMDSFRNRNIAPENVIAIDSANVLDQSVIRISERPIPRILIVSDNGIYRDALRLSLQQSGTIDVIGACGGGDAEERIRQLEPTALLLDAAVPGGALLPQRAKYVAAEIITIILASSDEHADFLAWTAVGISGYVDRNGSVADIAASIGGALRGELVCSPLRTALLLERIAMLCVGRSKGRNLEVLTSREREVVAYLTEGLPNKVIARRMRITESTVKNHVHSILEKTGTQTRGEAAARFRADQAGRV
jgi:two-component system, NarL family, nitrate/nitrite response regulator NarL